MYLTWLVLALGFQMSADLKDLGEDGLIAMWTTPAADRKSKGMDIELKNWAEFRNFDLRFGMSGRKSYLIKE